MDGLTGERSVPETVTCSDQQRARRRIPGDRGADPPSRDWLATVRSKVAAAVNSGEGGWGLKSIRTLIGAIHESDRK